MATTAEQMQSINKQKAQLSLGKTDRTAYVRSSASDFQSRTKSDFSEVTRFIIFFMHAMLRERCSRKLQSTLV